MPNPQRESLERFVCGAIPPTIIVAIFAIGVALTAARIVRQYQQPGPFDWSRQGYCDFHNGYYYPALALRRGVNPYGQEFADTYPVDRQIPFFSPLIVAFHVPLTLLSLRQAEIIHFGLNLVLLVTLAWLSAGATGIAARWQTVLLLATLLVYARPGQTTLFTGYFTLELVIGSVLALQYARRRPWLAAFGLVLASGKPTYVIPLAVMMLFRGNWRAVILGGALSAAGALACLAWLSLHSSPQEVISSIRTTQEIHQAEVSVLPENSWTRLDLLALVAKWTRQSPADTTYLAVMGLVLLAPGWAVCRLRRIEPEDSAANWTAMIICLAMLCSIYHSVYDALLLCAPLLGLAICRPASWAQMPIAPRALLFLLAVVPAVNYASAGAVLQRLDIQDGWIWTTLTSINGVALVLALALATLAALWRTASATQEPRAG